jgi:hypothetical protein
MENWTLEPRGCTSAFRENNSALFFRTGETVGRISPNVDEPEWVAQVAVPQNSRINLLFNGFCAYAETAKQQYGAEVLVIEPGVLRGRGFNIPPPALATDYPVEHDGIHQWLGLDYSPVLLSIRGDDFCLITKNHLKTDAVQLADALLDTDMEALIRQERELREGATRLFQEMVHHDSLAVICAENMMKALRPAEGNIPLQWCQASGADAPRMDINEMFPLAMAWRLMDIRVAEELVLCALLIQSNAGAIPVHFSPHATYSTIVAPKPMLAKTVLQIWEVRKDPEFLGKVIKPLRRHIQWMLHHFDPKRRGAYCWKNAQESLLPDAFKSDMATVDLAVLLITEIEALNNLRKEAPEFAGDDEYFKPEHEALEHAILEQFWNDRNAAFTNALMREERIDHPGFPAFTPLLWKKLPPLHKSSILERIHESGTLPGGLSVLSWRKSSLDDQSFPLLQQMMVFLALQTADPHGMLLNDFSRITLQGFVEWHTLSIESEGVVQINPVMAAYIMNVQAIRQYRYHGKGAVSGYLFKSLRRVKADRFDLVVIASVLFALYSVRTIYDLLAQPPPYEMLEAQINSAYAEKNIEEVLVNCRQIIHHYPDNAGMARLMAGNISLLGGQPEITSQLFEELRKSHPDSPGPMIALGLAYQFQGLFPQAETNYYEFCYIFEEIFPDLVREVNGFRYLMQEGFEVPPNWKNIYRYQLMHEL